MPNEGAILIVWLYFVLVMILLTIFAKEML